MIAKIDRPHPTTATATGTTYQPRPVRSTRGSMGAGAAAAKVIPPSSPDPRQRRATEHPDMPRSARPPDAARTAATWSAGAWTSPPWRSPGRASGPALSRCDGVAPRVVRVHQRQRVGEPLALVGVEQRQRAGEVGTVLVAGSLGLE